MIKTDVDGVWMQRPYSIPMAAKRWGLPEARLYSSIQRGELKAFRFRGARKGWKVNDQIMTEFLNNEMEVAGEAI